MRPRRLQEVFTTMILLFTVQLVYLLNKLTIDDEYVILDSPAISERKVHSGTPSNASNKSSIQEAEDRISLYGDDLFFNPHVVDWDVPKWIKDYISFHKEARRKYPGAELFTTNDTDAPKILIRICAGLCGGLNDRLGQLPTELHVANMTNRVLFILWVKPVPLEKLFLPNLIDWTVPKGIGYEQQRDVLAKPKFPVCWKMERNCVEMDDAIDQALHGPESKERVLTFMWVQHLNESIVESRLKALGETDMIHNTPTFGHIFWTFFRLNPNVKEEVAKAKHLFQLKYKSFCLLHCRVRHPRGLDSGSKILFEAKGAGKTIDQAGMKFDGEAKSFALSVVTHAMQCSRLITTPNEPLYFISDSEDLVNYITNELPTMHNTSILNDTDIAAQAVRSKVNIISRDLSLPNLHIDRQKRYPTYYYYPTIVDLIIAANARCIIHGVGRYTSLAAKISNNHCMLQHREEVWGFAKIYTNNLCTAHNYTHFN